MVVSLLLAGLLLSLFGGFYILRLERQGRKRYEALIENRRELEALSGRLVDAQEEERRAISRELHDEVGQTLGALLVELGQLAKFAPPEDKLLHAQIGRNQIRGGNCRKVDPRYGVVASPTDAR